MAAEIAGGDRARPQRCQRQAEAADTAAGVAEAALAQVALGLQPGQNRIHRLLVADADVALAGSLVRRCRSASSARSRCFEIGLHGVLRRCPSDSAWGMEFRGMARGTDRLAHRIPLGSGVRRVALPSGILQDRAAPLQLRPPELQRRVSAPGPSRRGSSGSPGARRGARVAAAIEARSCSRSARQPPHPLQQGQGDTARVPSRAALPVLHQQEPFIPGVGRLRRAHKAPGHR